MNKSTMYIIICLACILIISGLQSLIKKIKQNKLFGYLQKQDFEGFEKELDSSLCVLLIPSFNREYLRMNAYLMQGDLHKIEGQLEVLLKMKTNKVQRKQVVIRSFDFYVNQLNKPKSKELLNEIKQLGDEKLISNCQMMYDILIEKKTKYIDQLKQQVHQGSIAEQGMAAYLISLQYGYLNDKANEKKYGELAASMLK